MKMIHALLGIGFAAMLTLQPQLSRAAETVRFAHVYEVSHPLHKAALTAAERYAELTDGRYDIKVYPASSLGKEDALNEALSLGTIDIIYTGAGFAGSIYGPIAITDFPFTLRNLAHWRAYGESELFQDLNRGFAEATYGNTVVAINYYGTRHVTANKPILAPADMKNLKIRVPNAPAYVLFPKAIGANPTPMAFSEVYLGLQQGVVDAQENPLLTIQSKRFHEVQSDISLTGHITNSILTIVSGSLLERLSEEDSNTLRTVLADAADWVTEQIVQSEAELVAWFRAEGVNVHEVDRLPFIDEVRPALLSDDMPFSQETYERLQAIEDKT